MKNTKSSRQRHRMSSGQPAYAVPLGRKIRRPNLGMASHLPGGSIANKRTGGGDDEAVDGTEKVRQLIDSGRILAENVLKSCRRQSSENLPVVFPPPSMASRASRTSSGTTRNSQCTRSPKELSGTKRRRHSHVTASSNDDPSGNLILSKSNLNVSAGGVFYENAKSRRQRTRLALMSSGQSADAVPLGGKRRTPNLGMKFHLPAGSIATKRAGGGDKQTKCDS